MSLDARRGLFLLVIVAAGALLHAVMLEDPLGYVVRFEDAENLKRGDSLYLKGVEVGEVTDVDLTQELGVRVSVKIRERFRDRVTADLDHIIVNDKFLFGKKAVLLSPSGRNREPMKQGQEIQGTDYFPGTLLEQGARTASGLFKDLKRWGSDKVGDLGRKGGGWLEHLKRLAVDQEDPGSMDPGASPRPGPDPDVKR